jgi:hypothetical protein
MRCLNRTFAPCNSTGFYRIETPKTSFKVSARTPPTEEAWIYAFALTIRMAWIAEMTKNEQMI